MPEPEGGIEVRVEGDRVYGSASDMKSGDAVMLALLEGVAWEESRFEPVFVFYEREEGSTRITASRPSSLAARGCSTRSRAGARADGCGPRGRLRRDGARGGHVQRHVRPCRPPLQGETR